jgi:branched-chain amino acid transport system substrate-binding protein
VAQIKRNASRAARDRAAIAYVGDYESGATAFSLPILNRAGVAQISPSNTDAGLTTDAPGTERGEPEKHYPAKRRTFARIIPTAVAQAASLATAMRQLSCRTAYFVHDGDPYTKGLATMTRDSGRGISLESVGLSRVKGDKKSSFAADIAKVMRRDPDCVLYAGIFQSGSTARFLTGLNRVDDATWLLGGDPAAVPDLGVELNNKTRLKTRVTNLPLPRGAFPPAGLAFFERYLARYGNESYDPNAAYGYEAMSLVLDAIRRAKRPLTRASVVDAIFATRNRRSVLGTYSIDKNGDTTQTDYGLFRPTASGLHFDRVVRAQKSAG